jgi:hypothetical protein
LHSGSCLGHRERFFDEQRDLKSVDYKTERWVDGKMQSKDRNDSSRAENDVKEWSEEKDTGVARISEDDMRNILDDINVAQTKRRRPPTSARSISTSIQHGENAGLCLALLLTRCCPI